MILEKFACGPFETNTYLAGSSQEKVAAVIDPSMGSAPLVARVCEEQGLTLRHVLLTHSHWDHIADVSSLKEQFSLEVWIHSLDAPNLEKPGKDKLPLLFPIPGVTPDHLLKEGDEIKVGRLCFKVLHTPGHSLGSICFYVEKEKLLFSGDTLFQGTMGNIHFPTSSPKDMWKSLKRLAKLPEDTRVLPGHGPDTTIGEEKWIEIAEELYG